MKVWVKNRDVQLSVSNEIYILAESLVHRSSYSDDVHVKQGCVIKLVKEIENENKPFGYFDGSNYRLFVCAICCDNSTETKRVELFLCTKEEILDTLYVVTKKKRWELLEFDTEDDL